MNNPYVENNSKTVVSRLTNDCSKHGRLLIAFDFDNTVASYPDMEPYTDVIELLKLAKSKGHTLILFTANEGDNLKKRIRKCDEWGIRPDYINENPVMKTTKPYYNILLDDRAGLSESFNALHEFLMIGDNK